MREIKFRAWDGANSRMVYDEFYIHQKTGTCFYLNDSDTTGEPLYDCGEEEPTLMQFTGLKDKNGKEIYEGDIVIDTNKADVKLYGTRKGVITWDEDEAGFMVSIKGIQSESFYDYDGRNFIWQALEVTGNIYENPELLNQ